MFCCFLLLLAVLPFIAVEEGVCTVGTGNLPPCGKHTAIIVDNTYYMETADRSDKLLDYILTLLSAYGFDDQNQVYFSMGFYSIPAPTPGNGSCVLSMEYGRKTPESICDSFQDLKVSHDREFYGQATITNTMYSLFDCSFKEAPHYDHIIFFSASTNQYDIDEAAPYRNLLNSSFTVINIAPWGSFSSWSNTLEIKMPVPEFLYPDNFAETIVREVCGDELDSTIATQTPAYTATSVTYTDVPTFHPSVPPTDYPTVQPSVKPSVMPTDVSSQNCPCTPSKSWNDIYLAFDGSNALEQNRFEELVNYVFSAMSQLTIGQAEQYQTRAGIITYGDDARLLSDLDHYSDTGSFLDDIDNVKRTNTEGTNIVGAIGIATDVFKSSTHRPTSRKVMIIGASTYRNGNYESPITKATTFKDNGGIIIVISYGDLHGDVDAVLQEIASPGFFIDSTKKVAKVDQLISLICSANCFCPSTYSPDSTTHRGDPDDGCYQTSSLEATNQLAKHYCSREHQGKLSTVITPAQQIFVSKDVSGKEPIYVGLERSHGQWTWADGTPFSGAINDNGGDCATLTRVKGFKTQFDSVQCQMPYLYSCQATPCSTEVFCTQF